VVVDDTLYVGCTDHSVYALDAETGDERWSYATDNRVEATPAVADDTVYVGSYDMHVYAVGAETGDERWARELGGLVRGSPTVADDTVYVGVGCHNLACAPFAEEAGVRGVGWIYALDAASGETRWRYDVGNEVVSTPATDGETVYVGASDETLYALDATTGEPRWTYGVGDMVWSSPALAFGTVYFADWDGLVHAVDAASGERLWFADTAANYISGSVAVDGEAVYVGHTPYNSLDDPSPNYGTMFRFDRTTGAEQWQFETPAFEIGSSPVVSDDRLYFGTHGQTGSEDVGVYALSTDGEQQWYMEIGGRGVGASPVLLDGTLYFSGTDGRVYAVE
jgi:outer membrane protein assembly factor BamB